MAQFEDISEVIGLVPAAGEGTRLGPLPWSKELYPTGIEAVGDSGKLQVKVAVNYLLERMETAGVKKVFCILKKGKWDIPGYLCDGHRFGLNISYLVMESSPGVPFTIDRAYPFVKDKKIAIGFSDILIDIQDPYTRLLKRLEDINVDVVLGCFNVKKVGKFDMIHLNKKGNISRIAIKPKESRLKFAWATAVWNPKFTDFVHEYLAVNKNVKSHCRKGKEVYLGHLFNAALKKNIRIEPVFYPGSYCVDIGTPDDLLESVYELNGNERW